MDPKRICVLTVAIGADYRKGLAKALQSKRDYCARHGQTQMELHDDAWNRERPISWSKVPIYRALAGRGADFDQIWASDADVQITNPDIRLEDHVLPLLPANKDLLLTQDSCQHINAGNMILRPCAWLADFFQRVWDRTDCIQHIWWENAAICKLMAESPEDNAHIEVTMEAHRFNAQLRGYRGTRQWLPGDLLVHFAGVQEAGQMDDLIRRIDKGETPRLPM